MKMPMDGQPFQFFPELDSSDLSPQVFGYLLPRIQTVGPEYGRFEGCHLRPKAFAAKDTVLSHSVVCVSLYIARGERGNSREYWGSVDGRRTFRIASHNFACGRTAVDS